MLYVSDAGNFVIMKIYLPTGAISNFIGQSEFYGNVDGIGCNARIGIATGIASGIATGKATRIATGIAIGITTHIKNGAPS